MTLIYCKAIAPCLCPGDETLSWLSGLDRANPNRLVEQGLLGCLDCLRFSQLRLGECPSRGFGPCPQLFPRSHEANFQQGNVRDVRILHLYLHAPRGRYWRAVSVTYMWNIMRHIVTFGQLHRHYINKTFCNCNG